MKVSKKKKVNKAKLDPKERSLRTKLYLILAAVGIVVYGLYGFLLTPLNASITVDYEIGLFNPVAYEFVRFVLRLVEMLTVALLSSIVIYGIYRFSVVKFIGGFFIFTAIGVYKYTTMEISSWIESGFVPSDFLWKLLDALGKTALWLIPFIFAFFAVSLIVSKYRARAASAKKEKKEEVEKPLPFTKIFSFSNCLLTSAFVSSIMVILLPVFGQAFYDILTIEEITNVPLMVLDYLSHIIFAVLCYFVMILVISFIGEKLGGEERKIKLKQK